MRGDPQAFVHLRVSDIMPVPHPASTKKPQEIADLLKVGDLRRIITVLQTDPDFFLTCVIHHLSQTLDQDVEVTVSEHLPLFKQTVSFTQKFFSVSFSSFIKIKHG